MSLNWTLVCTNVIENVYVLLNYCTSVSFVGQLYRHGDRSPISTFPTDKVPISTWYEGLGQLTRVGA